MSRIARTPASSTPPSRTPTPPPNSSSPSPKTTSAACSYLTTDADHLAAIKDNKNPTRQVRVPVTTMNALLEGETRPIAAASIDVEGGEVDLLKGFDLARHRPRILIIEDNTRSNPGPAKVSPVERDMLTQPYTYVGFIGCNRLYIRADLTDLIARARAM